MNACGESDASMPAAADRLNSDPDSCADSMHTRLPARSRLMVAARLIGAIGPHAATQTSCTFVSRAKNARASSAEVSKANQR